MEADAEVSDFESVLELSIFEQELHWGFSRLYRAAMLASVLGADFRLRWTEGAFRILRLPRPLLLRCFLAGLGLWLDDSPRLCGPASSSS